MPIRAAEKKLRSDLRKTLLDLMPLLQLHSLEPAQDGEYGRYFAEGFKGAAALYVGFVFARCPIYTRLVKHVVSIGVLDANSSNKACYSLLSQAYCWRLGLESSLILEQLRIEKVSEPERRNYRTFAVMTSEHVCETVTACCKAAASGASKELMLGALATMQAELLKSGIDWEIIPRRTQLT